MESILKKLAFHDDIFYGTVTGIMVNRLFQYIIFMTDAF